MALMCVAAGLALSRTSRSKDAWLGYVALIASALVASLLPIPAQYETVAFIGLWLSVAATAAFAIFSPEHGTRFAIPLAINAGIWAGGLATVSSNRTGLALAFPFGLVFMLGQWLGRNGYGVAVKVLASWAIAIAMLAFFVTLIPTAGYEADHME